MMCFLICNDGLHLATILILLQHECTALHIAAQNGHDDVVNILLSYNAVVDHMNAVSSFVVVSY